MPALLSVHYPIPVGPPDKVAPPQSFPPTYTPGQGTGTQGSNSPFQGNNYQAVNCTKQDRSFRLVYATGANAVATDSCDFTYPVVGMLIVKQGDTSGIMQTEGRVAQVQGLVPQQRYFLGENGQLTAPPFAVGQVHYVQQVGYGLDDGTFYLQPTGIVYARDTSQGGSDTGADAGQEQATVGSGAPNMQAVYPPENVYIDSNTGDWYEQPATSGPSQFFVGYGPPQGGQSYAPVQVYVDTTQGGYYTQGDQDDTYVPITSGEGAPTNAAVPSYRNVYFNSQTGDAYYE